MLLGGEKTGCEIQYLHHLVGERFRDDLHDHTLSSDIVQLFRLCFVFGSENSFQMF